MRYEGKIVKWYDEKGFGFIRTTHDSKDVFLHISQIHRLRKKPEINELVSYEITRDEKGRFRALNVSYLSDSKYLKSLGYSRRHNATSFNYSFLFFTLIFLAFVIERSLKGFLPLWFPLVFLGVNLTIFLFYYQDKTSAVKNQWRISENTLHWFSLIGGWGGAYVAQKVFKHKHKKQSFLFIYKLTVLINCLTIILYSVPQVFNILLNLL